MSLDKELKQPLQEETSERRLWQKNKAVSNRYPEITSPYIIPVHISPKVMMQSRALCNRIPNLEWCTVTLYSEQGDISDPENFSVIVEDMCPMNVGSKGYTSFSLADEGVGLNNLIKFRQERFDAYLEGQKRGFMHSHNTFDVFFSGTDIHELHDNADKFVYYLSVITNNENEWTARIGQLIDVESVYSAVGTNGDKYKNNLNGGKMLMVYECEVIFDFDQDEIFDELLDNIVEDYNSRPAPVAKNYTPAKGLRATSSYSQQLDLFDEDEVIIKPKIGENIDAMLRGTLGQCDFKTTVRLQIIELSQYLEGDEFEKLLLAEFTESFEKSYKMFEQDVDKVNTLEEMIQELKTATEYKNFTKEIQSLVYLFRKIQKNYNE